MVRLARERDLVTAPFVLADDGTLPVPQGPGIGVEVDPDRLEEVTRRRSAAFGEGVAVS